MVAPAAANRLGAAGGWCTRGMTFNIFISCMLACIIFFRILYEEEMNAFFTSITSGGVDSLAIARVNNILRTPPKDDHQGKPNVPVVASPFRHCGKDQPSEYDFGTTIGGEEHYLQGKRQTSKCPLVYIITPCSRPEYLHDMRNTFRDDIDGWVWIVVHNQSRSDFFFDVEDEYVYEYNAWGEGEEAGNFGNYQRNYGINLVSDKDAYIYFLDDDNGMHENFYSLVYPLLEKGENDFITFDQFRVPEWRLDGPFAKREWTDTSMFVAQRSIIQDIRWQLPLYNADGYFAEAIQENAKTHTYIHEICAWHNLLKQNFTLPASVFPRNATNKPVLARHHRRLLQLADEEQQKEQELIDGLVRISWPQDLQPRAA